MTPSRVLVISEMRRSLYLSATKVAAAPSPPPSGLLHVVQPCGIAASRFQYMRIVFCRHGVRYLSESGGPESSITVTGVAPNAICVRSKLKSAPKPPADEPDRITRPTLVAFGTM